MCRTPAPPSTPFVAAAIWSGTGEVKTSPAHAASSMPMPTNPPCIGSRPRKPPPRNPPLHRPGARTAPEDESDLALHRRAPAEHDPVLVVYPQLGMGRRH